MKDFATKRARVDGKIEEKILSQGAIAALPIGRWILLGIVVLIMVGYAIWSHHAEFSGWLSSLGHHHAPAVAKELDKAKTDSKTSLKNSSKNSPAPQAVQFDFYHVLASDTGKGQGKVEWLSSSSVAVPSNESDDESSQSNESSQVSVKSLSQPQKQPQPQSQGQIQDQTQTQAQDESRVQASVRSSSTPRPAHSANQAVSTAETPSAPVKVSVPETIKSSKATPVKLVAKAPPKNSAKTPVKPAPKPVIKTQDYDVQVGIFSSKDKAEATRAKLMLLGFEPKVAKSAGGLLRSSRYLVHFGLIKNEHSAEVLKHQLEKAGITSSIVSIMTTENPSGDSHAA